MAWRAIVACRTAALGDELLACISCGHQHGQYHSCRNRHCPQCGARAKDAWLQDRLAELLPVCYVHLVFTLPHELNALNGAHPRWMSVTADRARPTGHAGGLLPDARPGTEAARSSCASRRAAQSARCRTPDGAPVPTMPTAMRGSAPSIPVEHARCAQ